MPTTPRIPGARFLHSPGPTRVPDEVVHAMSRQPMDLADPRVSQTIAACESGLKRLLHTRDADILMFACNGHGVWEGVIANLLGPGDAVLVPGTGHFSDGWAAQCEAFGATAIRTPWVEGEPIDAGAVEQALSDDLRHRIKAVFAVHTDTASSVTSDMRGLRAAIDAARHPALFVVDVVASLGAAPFAMDELGVNVVVGASQKGLMVPPGLGFIGVDARAMQAARGNTAPRFYWDWARRISDLSYMKFCGTPPQSLLAGLEAALGLIFWRASTPCWSATHASHAPCTPPWIAGAKVVRCVASRLWRRRALRRSRRSRCAPASTSRHCAAWRVSAFRWPLPAVWGRWQGACFASAISVT